MRSVNLCAFRPFMACGICAMSEPVLSQQQVAFADLQDTIIRVQTRLLQEGVGNGQPFKNEAESIGTVTVNSRNDASNNTGLASKPSDEWLV
jgi:hypothetical protein